MGVFGLSSVILIGKVPIIFFVEPEVLDVLEALNALDVLEALDELFEESLKLLEESLEEFAVSAGTLHLLPRLFVEPFLPLLEE